MIHKDARDTHEMIPMHSPSTPRLEASLFFHPWPTRPSPTVFWLAEAINTKGIIKLALRSFQKQQQQKRILTNQTYLKQEASAALIITQNNSVAMEINEFS